MNTGAMLRGVLLAMATLATAACHDGPFNPYWDRGTYDLVAANNRYVPSSVYSVTTAGRTDHIDVLGGALTLHGDGTYELLVRARETFGSQTTDITHAYAGSYDDAGSVLYLSYDIPGSYYTGEMQATWRDGVIETVVPAVALDRGVLMRFGRY